MDPETETNCHYNAFFRQTSLFNGFATLKMEVCKVRARQQSTLLFKKKVRRIPNCKVGDNEYANFTMHGLWFEMLH
jgi:hypothetical protein